jgi:PPOX class probable F420-dependent enzyme
VAETTYPASHKDILDAPGFAHLATLGPDGAPQSSPVWYEWTGSELLISHTKNRQKYRNIRRDARVALSILDPDDPYRYLEVRGTVELIDDPEAELIHTLAKKYTGKDRYQGEVGERVIFKIEPTKVNPYG